MNENISCAENGFGDQSAEKRKNDDTWINSNQCISMYESVQKTATLCPHFDFISISEGGSLMLGASNHNGRFWTGFLYFYAMAESSLIPSKYTTKMYMDTGLCDGKFLDINSRMLLGDDAGTVGIYTVTKDDTDNVDEFYVFIEAQTQDHDDSVLSLTVTEDKKKAASASADKSIKIWDLESLNSELTYYEAHSDRISQISYLPSDKFCFVSVSLDGRLLLWDIRKSKPAQTINNGSKMCCTTFDWLSNSPNEVIVGSEDGAVSIIDIRHVNKVVSSSDFFKVPVHKLVMCPKRKMAAICADSNVTKVVDYSEQVPVMKYINAEHKDYVRGLAWLPSKDGNSPLFSCAWDGQILKHTIDQ